MSLAAIFNGKMIPHLGRDLMLQLGWGLIFMSGVIMIIGNLLYGQTLLSLLCPIFIFLFGATLIWPSTFAGAFAPFGTIAGCAGSLYSAIQLGGGAIISGLSSFLPTENPYLLAIIFMFASIIAWVIFEVGVRKRAI